MYIVNRDWNGGGYCIVCVLMCSGETYLYGTKLAYVAIVVNTTLELATLGFPEVIPIRNTWEEWMDTQVGSQLYLCE